MENKTLHIGSQELSFSRPCVMGILNVTPDSFYAPSRVAADDLLERARGMLNLGASILDIGGCSTRPGYTDPGEAEEWRRVAPALETLRTHLPDALLSLDTFRASIAERAIREFGPMIINDISGGDKAMYEVVRRAQVPYVLTIRRPSDETADIPLIWDPGIGFLGGPEADFRALQNLHEEAVPVLVGVSRKSLIWRTLQTTPQDALPATQALHMYALLHGADILRVHDVREAAETVTLYEKLKIDN
ncbi:MAG: dihydropteroate synthase [Paludibacteraceae bacterium]|nr:dihydropteroate synthase [Paludibacteraceae bacterium]